MTMILTPVARKPLERCGREFMEERAMPWLSKTDAARALGVSPRTLTRGLADGMLEARRDGPHVLIHVRDEVNNKPSLGKREVNNRPRLGGQQRSGEVDQHSAVGPGGSDGLQADEPGAGAGVMAAIREVHAAFEETAAIAKLGAQHTLAAEQRTAERLKWAGATSIAAVVIVAAVAGWTAWQYDRSSAGQPRATHELAQGLADVRADLVAVSEVLQGKLDADRQATTRMLNGLEDRLSKAQRESLEARNPVPATTLGELDQRFSELRALLQSIEAEQGVIACELNQLSAERAQLARAIEELMPGTTRAAPEPTTTLREMIDEDWSPRR